MSPALDPEEFRSQRSLYAAQQIQKENVTYLALTSLIPLLGWAYTKHWLVMSVATAAAFAIHRFIRIQLLRRDYCAFRVRLYDEAIHQGETLISLPPSKISGGNQPRRRDLWYPTKKQLEYRKHQPHVGPLKNLHDDLLEKKASDSVRKDEKLVSWASLAAAVGMLGLTTFKFAYPCAF